MVSASSNQLDQSNQVSLHVHAGHATFGGKIPEAENGVPST